jgi:hypothetical protein
MTFEAKKFKEPCFPATNGGPICWQLNFPSNISRNVNHSAERTLPLLIGHKPLVPMLMVFLMELSSGNFTIH